MAAASSSASKDKSTDRSGLYYLTKLGKALKHKREPGEQFCVFAFDCCDQELEPIPEKIAKRDLPLEFQNDDSVGDADRVHHNWDAAFFTVTQPRHTEQAVLERFEQWIADYSSCYGAPTALYIYSYLIPCMRDGKHGECADGIAAMIKWCLEVHELKKVCIGWSNPDRDGDIAAAIMDLLKDLEDDVDIAIYPVISIAG